MPTFIVKFLLSDAFIRMVITAIRTIVAGKGFDGNNFIIDPIKNVCLNFHLLKKIFTFELPPFQKGMFFHR